MERRPLRPRSRRWIGSRIAAPRTAISSITCQVMSTSLARGFSRAIVLILGSQTSASFFRTSPTMVGLDVAPTAPRATAYSSSARAHESFQYSVGVVLAIFASGLSRASATGCIRAPIHQPGMARVEGEPPLSHGTRHHVEVLAVVAGRRSDRMVATRDEDDVAIHRAQGGIQGPVGGVHALEGEALRPAETVVV